MTKCGSDVFSHFGQYYKCSSMLGFKFQKHVIQFKKLINSYIYSKSKKIILVLNISAY